MRLRFAMLCAALSALALVAGPGLAGAAPRHNHGLTINATPNPIQAGEGVLIYGQLKGTDISGKTVVLYHHVNGSHQGYTVIGEKTTDSFGFYEFTREEGVVNTNRQWFVRLAAEPGVHSRTVSERVAALVSLAASSSSGDTRHAITFSGHVYPDHGGQRVLLQQQGNGDDWRTLKVGRLGPDSSYSISYAWRVPGEHNVRVVFPGDGRNVRGVSDSVTVTIQQTQNPSFTTTTTTPAISYGQSAVITGTLDAPGTTTPQATTAITLCHRNLFAESAICDVAGSTDGSGNYSFSVSPTRNAWYFVRVTLKPAERTSDLFIGVKDIITLSASSTGTVGQADTFSGTVTPNKAGDVVYLQRKGADGDFHTVGTTLVQGDGSYTISRGFGTAGTKVFRTRILPDAANLGAVSQPVTLTVSLPSSPAVLPPAS